LPVEWIGLNGKSADVFNDIMALNERLAKETERAAKVVGKEGKIAHRVNLGCVEGAWASQSECLNTLISDLTTPTREMARVIGAVARGDLTQTAALEMDGRPLQGRVPARRQDGQHHGRAVGRVHRGSHPGGARGRHRGQTRRPGAGQGRLGHLEGPH
jgi:hypothetical protein